MIRTKLDQAARPPIHRVPDSIFQPAFLSGVAPGVQKFLRDGIIEAKAPEQAAQLKAFAEQDGLASMFRENLLQSVSDLVDFNRAEEIEAAAREDAA